MKNFRQQHRPKKSSLIVGRNAVKDALASGRQLEKIYLERNAHGTDIEEIKELAEEKFVPVSKVPVEKLNYFNVTNHGGCVASLSRIRYQHLQDVISFVVEKGETPLFLLLDGITDIRNIGAIARSAFCLGAHAIIIPERGIGAFNEDAMITSAGALEKLAVCRVTSLMKAVDELHLNGIRVIATEMTASQTINKADMTVPLAIVMGSEDNGIYPALMKICDEQVQIPMAGDFESLNVSVATGIILYEVMRQRL